LEESLTLTELIEIYKAIGIRDWETHRVIFGAAGGDLPNPYESKSESLTGDDIKRRASGDRHNDIADMNDMDIHFDYEVEHN
jgi:hypothetical protein